MDKVMCYRVQDLYLGHVLNIQDIQDILIA